MSALGQKQTSQQLRVMSALPPKADIAERDRDVHFVPKADIMRFSKQPPNRPLSSICSPTAYPEAPRRRAGSSGGKRPGANGARSTRRAAPSMISSPIASPVAGALSMPQTLWPVAT
jgi:hypothetical protein